MKIRFCKLKVRSFFCLALLCLLIVSLGSCGYRTLENGVIYCANDENNPYPALVSQMLRSYTVKITSFSPFLKLEEGAVIEASDVMAASALETGAAKYWYPQYLATVVIAVDRGMTDARINSWSDLPACGEVVGFITSRRHLRLAAMAFGLEGESFSLKKAAALLRTLQANNRLIQNSFKPPIVICYDYEAAQMIKQGRNIEIVVPDEGTLSYEKGLLSNTPLVFAGDAESLLLAAGFRLVGAYDNAHRVTDYGHFSTVSLEGTRTWRRGVLRVRFFSGADGRENQLFALLYIIILVVWTASIMQRAMLKGVRQAALFIGIIMFGWIIVRLVRSQFAISEIFSRHMWYSYYLFQLALPLVLLWLAWVIGRPAGKLSPPKWLRAMFAVNVFIFILVFTNDLHFLVFPLDINSPRWESDYGYGIGFYILLAGSILPLLPAVFMLLRRRKGNTRKFGFVFPLAFCVLLAAYSYGYANRIPIAWESDISMFIGLFILLFSESLIRSGAIPVNTKYAALFTHSPLGMRIVDNEGVTALSSTAALREDEDTLILSAPITGGEVQWQEDISNLNRLHRDIERSVTKLSAANVLLEKQERIKRAVDEENAKMELTAQLEAEIAGHLDILSNMIEQPAYQGGRVAPLLCYIKRRCNLFFRERETKTLPMAELSVYMDELAEIGRYSGVKTIVTNEVSSDISVRYATLFYDFLYSVIDWVSLRDVPAEPDGSHIIAQLGTKNGNIILWLLLSKEAAPDMANFYRMNADLGRAVDKAGGAFAIKDLDDAAGLSLSLPLGSEDND